MDTTVAVLTIPKLEELLKDILRDKDTGGISFVSLVLRNYGTFISGRGVYTYKLEEAGNTFAREGCYSGIEKRNKLEEERAAKAALLTENQMKEIKQNKILAIAALIISAISLIASLL